jgi:hypothetical protein
MTARDVLISRTDDGPGSPIFAVTFGAPGRSSELWTVTAEGQASLTLQSFTEALDVALTWAVESDGKIYRRGQLGSEPRLYNGAW